MFHGPKRLKMPSVNYATAKRKVMFIVRLRKHIFVILTCNINRRLISVFQASIWKGKVFTRSREFLFYYRFTTTYLLV